MQNKLPGLREISRAYDQRFARGDFRESDSFYRWVLKCLNPAPQTSLLDISCGEGHLLKWASRLYDVGVWGIDISTVALRLSRQNAPGARLARCDGINLPLADDVFHYVTNLGSLEHYTDVLQGVREVARVLKPEGRAAILLPNSYYLADIIWLVWRTGYGPSHQQTLEQFATAGEWRDILAQGGIEVLRTYAYNFRLPVSASDWRWYRERPHKFLNLLIAPFTPFHLAYCFLFVGRKRQAGDDATDGQ
jgi:SAM-dependent methyltransferase